MDTKHLDKWLGQLDVYGFLCAGGCSRTIGPKSIRFPVKKHRPQWMCFETHLCGTTVKHGKHCEITRFSSQTLHSSHLHSLSINEPTKQVGAQGLNLKTLVARSLEAEPFIALRKGKVPAGYQQVSNYILTCCTQVPLVTWSFDTFLTSNTWPLGDKNTADLPVKLNWLLDLCATIGSPKWWPNDFWIKGLSKVNLMAPLAPTRTCLWMFMTYIYIL